MPKKPSTKKDKSAQQEVGPSDQFVLASLMQDGEDGRHTKHLLKRLTKDVEKTAALLEDENTTLDGEMILVIDQHFRAEVAEASELFSTTVNLVHDASLMAAWTAGTIGIVPELHTLVVLTDTTPPELWIPIKPRALLMANTLEDGSSDIEQRHAFVEALIDWLHDVRQKVAKAA